jgi:hypothetical protein
MLVYLGWASIVHRPFSPRDWDVLGIERRDHPWRVGYRFEDPLRARPTHHSWSSLEARSRQHGRDTILELRSDHRDAPRIARKPYARALRMPRGRYFQGATRRPRARRHFRFHAPLLAHRTLFAGLHYVVHYLCISPTGQLGIDFLFSCTTPEYGSSQSP